LFKFWTYLCDSGPEPPRITNRQGDDKRCVMTTCSTSAMYRQNYE